MLPSPYSELPFAPGSRKEVGAEIVVITVYTFYF